MSDQKLRELERRWRETGSVEDEAAYLRERVRVGDLTQERLELAAYCGHEGARVAANSTAVNRDHFLLGLSQLSRELVAQAAVAVAGEALRDCPTSSFTERLVRVLTTLATPVSQHSRDALREAVWESGAVEDEAFLIDEAESIRSAQLTQACAEVALWSSSPHRGHREIVAQLQALQDSPPAGRALQRWCHQTIVRLLGPQQAY